MGHGIDSYLGLNKIGSPSPMMNFITISYLFNFVFGFICYDFFIYPLRFWIYPLGFSVGAYK